MKYVDASAMLRILFAEPGVRAPLTGGEAVVSSQLIVVECYRSVDRERLLGRLDDAQVALKRNELGQLLERIDLVPIDSGVIDRAMAPFMVNVRALDAIHVATAETLRSSATPHRLEFWTHDSRQATAALSRGLVVRGV